MDLSPWNGCVGPVVLANDVRPSLVILAPRSLVRVVHFDPSLLPDHFQRHGREFRARDAGQYERLAADFLSGEARFPVEECYRENGDLIRYNPTTRAFGVLTEAEIIRTFMKTSSDYFKRACEG